RRGRPRTPADRQADRTARNGDRADLFRRECRNRCTGVDERRCSVARLDAPICRHDRGRRLRAEEARLMTQVTFASMIRRGLLADASGSIDVTVTVLGKPSITRPVSVMTPGDVIG